MAHRFPSFFYIAWKSRMCNYINTQTKTTKMNNLLLKQKIFHNETLEVYLPGVRNFSSFFISLLVFFGGLGFSLTSFYNCFQSSNKNPDLGIAQEFTMAIYGGLGLTVGLLLFYSVWVDLGKRVIRFEPNGPSVRTVIRGFPAVNMFTVTSLKSQVIRVVYSLESGRRKQDVFLTSFNKTSSSSLLWEISDPKLFETSEKFIAYVCKELNISWSTTYKDQWFATFEE